VRQRHAASLAVWVFLSTEVMFFAGLIAAYVVYRYDYPAAFSACSHHLERWVATFETADLLTSSLFMALAIHFIQKNARRLSVLCLALAFLGGAAFLVLHGHEYATDAMEGALPGRFYRLAELPAVGAPMFFALYFFITGLHAIHVAVGMGLIGYLVVQLLRGRYSPAYFNPMEGVGLYWHFVDMVWVFLYPLFYLIH